MPDGIPPPNRRQVTIDFADAWPFDVFPPIVEGHWYAASIDLDIGFDSGTFLTLKDTASAAEVGSIEVDDLANYAPNAKFRSVVDFGVAPLKGAFPLWPGYFYVRPGQGPVQLAIAKNQAVTTGHGRLILFDYLAPI